MTYCEGCRGGVGGTWLSWNPAEFGVPTPPIVPTRSAYISKPILNRCAMFGNPPVINNPPPNIHVTGFHGILQDFMRFQGNPIKIL